MQSTGRTNRRIIFTTLDDGSGGQPIDLAFFDDSHPAYAHTLFHSWLVVVRGTVQRRGRSVSVVGSRAWDLTALTAAHQDGGTAAVRRLLAAEPPTLQEPPTGRPSGDREQGAPARRMWHASEGSAG